ncbi:MAG TPA: glycosyltransferase [Candidatus Baltobacteraceae bacterium]|jgi:tetratricopeptide (TPR) repeat protein
MTTRARSVRPGVRNGVRPSNDLPFGLPHPPTDWNQKPAGVSLCMIVRNEERFLDRCLASVAKLVDEINIVDTGSSDRTVEIALRYGARIEHREWRNDFAWARNESLTMATRRWVLQLDADEEILPETADVLRRLRNVPAYLTALWVRCMNQSDQYHGGGQLSHVITRLFPNHDRIRFSQPIHEFISLDGSPRGIDAVASPLKIVHYGYMAEIVALRDKHARNLEIIEAAIKNDDRDAYHWYNLGVTTFLGGDNLRAVDAFERMWERCKDELRGFTPNGLQIWADTCSERLNDPQRGLELATLCLRHAPNYANGHFSAGKALMMLGRYEESRAMYEAAIADAPHNAAQFVVDDEVSAWKAHSEIGATYALQGDQTAALQWFDRGLANRPTIGPLRLNRARVLERLGRLPEAEAEFRGLFEEVADEPTIISFVNFLLAHDKETEALACIESSHAKVGREAAITLLIAAAAVEQKLGSGDGERHLRMALELAPGRAEILNPLEVLYTQRGDLRSVEELRAAERATAAEHAADFLRRSKLALATSEFDRALEIALEGLRAHASDAALAYNAAIALVNLNRKVEALPYLETIRAESGSVFIQGKYLEAVLLRELGHHGQALESVDEVLRQDGDQLDATLLRSGILEQLGREVEAELALVVAMPRSKQRIAVELAGLYLRTGRVPEAKRVAEEALL